MKREDLVDVAPALAEAGDGIEDGRWADAARCLLAAWRDCRSGRIARALAAVDLRLPPPAPLEGKLVRTRDEHWLALVELGDEESLRRALAAPWPTHPKEARIRLDALAEHVSARISNALLAVHRGSQYNSDNGRVLSREIFQLLIEQDDHAVTVELERLEQNTREAQRLGRGLLRRRRPQAPYLSPAGEAALARIEKALVVEERAGAPTRDNLLAAIYEAPHDDGPRLVYADVLVESGDPRGEFITLQLQHADVKRQNKLLRAASRAWFDGLDSDGATKIIHARGFPATATLSAGEVRAPAWATIETLHLQNECSFEGAPHMRGLRELYNLHTLMLDTTNLPDPALDVLVVNNHHDGLGIDTPYAPRTLGLARPHQMDRYRATLAQLRRMPIARRLETVRLGIGIRDLRDAAALAAETGYTIELTGASDLSRREAWSARITTRELHLHWAGAHPYADVAFESVFPILSQFASPAFEVLEVTGTDAGLERVQAGIARLIVHWPRLRSAQILGLDATVTN